MDILLNLKRQLDNYLSVLLIVFIAVSALSVQASENVAIKRVATPNTVLFVGNSLTYANNGIAKMLDALVAAGEASEDFFSYELTESGATLSSLSANANKLISARAWDAVVLQEFSNLPVVDYEAFQRGIESMMLDIRLQRAQPVFFMTWAYKEQPEMSAVLSDAYIRAGNEFKALVVPVGLAFSAATQSYPTIALYSDDRHPSVAGTYLAACVFYGSFFEQPASGIPFYGTLSKEQATALQQVADVVIKDFFRR